MAVVAARVGGVSVTVGDVERLIARTPGSEKVQKQDRPALEAEVLAALVQMELARSYVVTLATKTEVDVRLTEVEGDLASRGRKLSEWLRGRGINVVRLRHELAWEIGRRKFRERFLHEKSLQSYFEGHRREFDGTQVVVGQILITDPADEAGRMAKAEKLRKEIATGGDFAAIARKHSDSATAAQGGKMGPIPRHGVMVEAFSAAAFVLEVGQVSPPVVTPHGVHLIRCDAIEPGNSTLDQVHDAVFAAAEQELLDRLAAKQREKVEVEYTGKAAYLDPESGKLVR